MIAMLAFSPLLASAHTATPPADPMASVTVETLGRGISVAAPDHVVLLLRITMAPGAHIPMHTHPGQVILFVESGTFGTAFGEGDALITRVPVEDTPVLAQKARANVEEIMTAGASVTYSNVTTHIMRNPGDQPLVLLVSALLSADEPGFSFIPNA